MSIDMEYRPFSARVAAMFRRVLNMRWMQLSSMALGRAVGSPSDACCVAIPGARKVTTRRQISAKLRPNEGRRGIF